MRLLDEFGVCDCHSHVFGPFARFPLSAARTFDPPESPIEHLETLWEPIGIDRAVLVQGSAHGEDHRALLAAIARSPHTRRGVALIKADFTEGDLANLQQGGVRAIRFNWISHLLGVDSRSKETRLEDAAELLERISPLGWHVEIHIDVADLDLIARLRVPNKMPVVIDHMARIDVSASDAARQLGQLLRLLDRGYIWVKLSGADRLTTKCDDLNAALNSMRDVLAAAPERCVWGLDWPHVNLSRERSDMELAELLHEVARDEVTLEQILIRNPSKLYGFDSEAYRDW